MTTNRELSDEPNDENIKFFNLGARNERNRLHQALLSGLPERKTKTSKAETDWRYRKAQVYSQFDMDLEFDEALDQATRLINKVFNKEQ